MIDSRGEGMRQKSDLGSGQWRKLTAARMSVMPCGGDIHRALSTRDLLPEACKDKDLSTSPGIK